MRERFITAAIGIPIVLACVFSVSPWPLGVLAVIAATFALAEVFSLGAARAPWVAAAVAAVVLLSLAGFKYFAKIDELAAGSLALLAVHGLALAGCWWSMRSDRRPSFYVFAALYVGLPIVALLYLHQMHRSDPSAVGWDPWNDLLLVLLPIWAGDTAAIFVGRYWGRHKMAVAISPNKTWEGAAGNFVAATAVGAGISVPLGYPPALGLAAGAICGVLGQAGDLFESWLKRRAGIKDSGSILPGHGGVLDRIDSLLFAAIPVLAVVLLAGFGASR